MATPRTFPSEFYITVEEEGSDSEFFQPNLSLEECGRIGQKIRVGRYMLHEVITIVTDVIVKNTSPR